MRKFLISFLFLIPILVVGQAESIPTIKSQLSGGILGDLTVVDYILGFFFVGMALLLKWTWKTNKAVKSDPKTPHKFEWKFWFEDNLIPKLKSILMTIIVVYLSFRFATNIIGTPFTYFIALTVGLTIDTIISKIKRLQEKMKGVD